MITKTTVSGDLGRFQQGQVLTDRAEIAEYYRLSLNEGRDHPLQVPDAEILKVIDAVDVASITDGDVDSDIDVVRTEALEKTFV